MSPRNWHTPYARRVEYAGRGRHHVSRTRRPIAWALSKLRDLGDTLVVGLGLIALR